MSEFSVLYKKYSSVSNLTNDLNNSVITLKRRNLAERSDVGTGHPKLQVSEDDVAKAVKDIENILTDLEEFYNNQDAENELYELMDNALFKNQILENADFKNKILQALKKVRSNQSLTNSDLINIDKFISILDNEASVLYKKLRTNRR